MKRGALFLLKLTVSAGLLYIIFRRADPGVILAKMSALAVWSFATAMAFSFAAVLFASLRWRLFITPHPGKGRVFSLYLVGMFFNTVLPGLVGGDGVKGYYLFRDGRALSNTVVSLFMDRYLGYVILLGLGSAAYPFGWDAVSGTGLEWVFPGIVSAFIAASALLMNGRFRALFPALHPFFQALDASLRQKNTLFLGLLFSLLVQGLNIMIVYILSLGYGFDLSLTAILAFLPIIVTLSSLPISISGLGIRETSFVVFFGACGLGKEEALTLSLTWFAVFLATGLGGLLEYLRTGSGAAPGRR